MAVGLSDAPQIHRTIARGALMNILVGRVSLPDKYTVLINKTLIGLNTGTKIARAQEQPL